MLDYVKTKSSQGIFFTKPEEKIHLPDGAELVMRSSDQRFYNSFVILKEIWIFRNDSSTSPFDLDSFLVRSFSQQIREVNKDTGNENTLGP